MIVIFEKIEKCLVGKSIMAVYALAYFPRNVSLRMVHWLKFLTDNVVPAAELLISNW